MATNRDLVEEVQSKVDQKKAAKLVKMFSENFAQYDKNIDDDVRAVAIG